MQRRATPTCVWLIGSAVIAALCVAELAYSQVRSPLARRRSEPLAPPPQFDPATREAFFADALQQLGEKIEPSGATPTRPGRAEPSGGSQGAFAWSDLIAAETLEDEVKRMVPQLEAHVRSVGHFRSSGYRQARRDLTSLAALFGIIAEYDEPVRWKEQAPALKDLFGVAGQQCKAGSDASYRAASARAEQLRELVRGGRVDVPRQEPADWPETVDRAALMLRIEVASEERLKNALIDQRTFERSREQFTHEAELLAAVARLIDREGYEYADDDTFREHARNLEEACGQLRQAVQDADFEGVRRAHAAVRTSCEQCHVDYRG